MDVADDPAGQRDVEELRSVVRRHRSCAAAGRRRGRAATIFHRQAQHSVVSTRDPRRCRQRPAVDRAHAVDERARAQRARPGRRAPRPGPGSGPTPTPTGSSRHPLCSGQLRRRGPARVVALPERRLEHRREHAARTRSSAAAPGRARRRRPGRPGGPGRPRPARRRSTTIGAWVRYRLYDDEPRLRIGRASSTRKSDAGRPVARPASRHAIAGPSARSTQNRWSSVHTEPCHQIVASTGAAAASASQPHGHDRASLAGPDDAGGQDADGEQRGEIRRRLDHEDVQVRDVRAEDPHRGHDERDRGEHHDRAPPADHQQQQREQRRTAGPRPPSTRTPRWGSARRRCSAPAGR